jgi:choline dehydrogenase
MTSVVFKASEAALPAVRAQSSNAFIALLRTDPEAAEPDIQLVFTDAPYFSPALNGPADAYAICCSLMKPASRGSVRLAARDITVPPLIDPNYLSDQADVDRLFAGLRMASEIGNRESLKAWSEGEIFPGPAGRTGPPAPSTCAPASCPTSTSSAPAGWAATVRPSWTPSSGYAAYKDSASPTPP